MDAYPSAALKFALVAASSRYSKMAIEGLCASEVAVGTISAPSERGRRARKALGSRSASQSQSD
jgi:hypothetical protein